MPGARSPASATPSCRAKSSSSVRSLRPRQRRGLLRLDRRPWRETAVRLEDRRCGRDAELPSRTSGTVGQRERPRSQRGVCTRGVAAGSFRDVFRVRARPSKIDRSFVADLDGDSRNAPIVKATIGLARELGLQVIAEGVETREQLDLLSTWGCGQVQGFYFAKPLPAEEIEALLRKGTIGPRASRSLPLPARQPDGRPSLHP
jgi:hypothetical protein